MPTDKESEQSPKIDRSKSVWESQKADVERLLGEALEHLNIYGMAAPPILIREKAKENIINALSVLDKITPEELSGCGSSSEDELTNNMEEGELPSLCKIVFFGVVRDAEDVDGEPAYLVRCADCDEPVPFFFFDSEEEWQEHRKAVGCKPRIYCPQHDMFTEPPANEEPPMSGEKGDQYYSRTGHRIWERLKKEDE